MSGRKKDEGYSSHMSIEGPPEENELDTKFKQLSAKANEEILGVLIGRGDDERRIVDLGKEADDIFQERYERIINIYDRNILQVEKVSDPSKRRDALRLLVNQMAQAFSKDGFISEITGLRLAAALAQLFEEYTADDDKHDPEGNP